MTTTVDATDPAVEALTALPADATLDDRVTAVLALEAGATAARVEKVLWAALSRAGSPSYAEVLSAVKRLKDPEAAAAAAATKKATPKKAGKATKKGTPTSVATLNGLKKESALAHVWVDAGEPEGEWMASGITYLGRPASPLHEARGDDAVENARAAAKSAADRKAEFKELVAAKATGTVVEAPAPEAPTANVIDVTSTLVPSNGPSKRTLQRRARTAAAKAAKANAANSDAK